MRQQQKSLGSGRRDIAAIAETRRMEAAGQRNFCLPDRYNVVTDPGGRSPQPKEGHSP